MGGTAPFGKANTHCLMTYMCSRHLPMCSRHLPEMKWKYPDLNELKSIIVLRLRDYKPPVYKSL